MIFFSQVHSLVGMSVEQQGERGEPSPWSHLLIQSWTLVKDVFVQLDHICDWIFLVFLYPVQHRTWNVESFHWCELTVIIPDPWAQVLPGDPEC